MKELFAHLRFTGRTLLRRPGFTLPVLLTLALGIGTNTAILSVMNGVLVETLPFDEPDRLIMLRGRSAAGRRTWVAYSELHDWQERSRAFEAIAGDRVVTLTLAHDGVVEGVTGVEASANLFSVLRAEPLHGRVYTAEEDRPGGPAVAVVSHGFWQRRLGGRADAIGAVLSINEAPFEVIGVMRPGFVYPANPRDAEIWLPLGYFAEESWGRVYETHPGISATGRLAAGASMESARADMDRIAAELAEEHSESNRGRGVWMLSVREEVVGGLRPAIFTLAGAVLLVLAVACVNVVNLLLARGEGRRHELAVRRALGASYRRIVRQLLGESLLLALAGSTVGLAVAFATLQGLFTVVDVNRMPAFGEIAIHGRALAAALLLAGLTGLACGLAPALMGRRGERSEDLFGGVKGSQPPRRGRILQALTVAQIAVSLALSICSVLAVRSFHHVLTDDAGFDPHDLLTFLFVLPDRYDEETRQALFFEEMLRRLESLPQVLSASTTVRIVSGWSSGFEPVERPPGEEEWSARLYKVSHGYFETLGVRLLRGRGFLPRDRADAPGVVIVDRLFAETVWPDEEALGQRLRVGPDPASSPGREVVGVMEHVNYRGPHHEMAMTFYQPSPQAQLHYGWGLVRCSSDPAGLAAAVRRELAELEPDLLVDELVTMDERLAAERAPQRLTAVLLGAFAALALALAGVGVYGVLSYSVAARRREIGIRMALGARPGDVARLVLRRGLGWTLQGVVLGLALTLGATRLLASQLYRVDPSTPSIWLATALFLALTALAACAVPAWRASRVEPTAVLHDE